MEPDDAYSRPVARAPNVEAVGFWYDSLNEDLLIILFSEGSAVGGRLSHVPLHPRGQVRLLLLWLLDG